jgi:phage tail sheath protein FI
VPNTTRTVPYCAVQAGMMARTSQNPNVAVAGVNGISRAAINLSLAPFTEQDRGDLNTVGVNVARLMFDGVRTYGYRSLAAPVDYSQWVQLSAVRLFMEIKAKCAEVLERHMFVQMDGQGIEFGSLAGDLTAAIGPYWQPMQALYGNTSREAFVVDTGPAVNTPATVANGELRARVSLRVSPFAELVILDLVNQRITEAL